MTDFQQLTIGERVKHLRESMNLGVVKFATMAKIARETLSRAERNDPKIGFSLKMVEAIASTFNVNYDWLLKGEGEIFRHTGIKEDDKTTQKDTGKYASTRISTLESEMVKSLELTGETPEFQYYKKLEYLLRLGEMKEKGLLTEESFNKLRDKLIDMI